jgi:hypothetical protein
VAGIDPVDWLSEQKNSADACATSFGAVLTQRCSRKPSADVKKHP